MTESTARPALPDRLSTDEKSRFYVAAVLEHDIGVRFNGQERSDVDEYCVSEGWIKVAAGKTMPRPHWTSRSMAGRTACPWAARWPICWPAWTPRAGAWPSSATARSCRAARTRAPRWPPATGSRS